ncbi:hypothetical protein HN873_052631, partial [Arachis hypogaea]
FEWRPYDGLIIPDELHGHLEVCDIVVPLLSFECVEWHPVDRVMRQFGYAQPPPREARDIPLDQHCIVLRGVQLHDWTVLHRTWIGEWANRRNSRLRDQYPVPTWDFLPTVEYRDWYVASYGHILRLSEYVPQHPQPPAPQPPAPQGPPQHAVFELFPYYIPQPPDHSHGSRHTQDSHHSQYSQGSHHSQSNHHSRHSQHSHHSRHS